MGDVYLLRKGFLKGHPPIESIVVSSESMEPNVCGDGVLRFVNGSKGIFFYEADLLYCEMRGLNECTPLHNEQFQKALKSHFTIKQKFFFIEGVIVIERGKFVRVKEVKKVE